MSVYLTHLFDTLDQERPGWRRDTVIMLDNAPYHRAGAVLSLFQEKKVPVLFTGLYSYDASPVELFFAAFKAADINPRLVPTGKG